MIDVGDVVETPNYPVEGAKRVSRKSTKGLAETLEVGISAFQR